MINPNLIMVLVFFKSLRNLYKIDYEYPYINYTSWDIITSKYFYIPVLSIISIYFGLDYYKYFLPGLPIIVLFYQILLEIGLI